VSLQLASLGYKIIGYDVKDYDFSHPNFIFIKGDFFDNKLKSESFDYVFSISVIEHAGIGYYGDKPLRSGDKKMVDEIYRILKHNGYFMISVPFNKRKLL